MGWIDDFLRGLVGGASTGNSSSSESIGRYGGITGGLFGKQIFGSPTENVSPVAKPIPSAGEQIDLVDLINPNSTTGRPQLDFGGLLGYPGLTKSQQQTQNPNINVPQVDPYSDLNEIYRQLLANMATSGASGGLSNADIRAQVAAKYDPQVNQIRREMGITKGRYNENKGTVKDLYNELQADFKGEVKGIDEFYSGAKNEEKARMGALQNRIKSNYDDSFTDQSEQFAKLGISSALPAATQDQRTDLEYLQNLSQVEGESVMRDIEGQGRANRDYFNKGAALADMQGAEVITDLLNEFSDYQTMRQGDITDLESARSSDISSLMAQAAQQRAQTQNDIFSRLLQVGNFGMDLTKLQASQQPKAPTAASIGKGITGASNVLNSIGNPDRSRALMGIFQEVMQQQPFRENRFETASGDVVNMTPEQAVKYMLDQANRSGVSDQEKLALMNAVYAYYGRFS